MNTKLTLSIEQSVIDTAKQYAKYKERSLSDIIENYLKLLIINVPSEDNFLTPTVKMLKGSFQAPEHFDYKEELQMILTEKYLQS